MTIWRTLTVAGFLLAALTVRGQDETFQSGLKPAAAGKPPTKMPHSFDVHTFNGKNADRFHCLVCENDIHPTFLMFLKEPAEGKEKALESLLTKLDELIDKYQVMDKYPEVTTFAAYAIFLNPAALTSLDDQEAPKLLKKTKDDPKDAEAGKVASERLVKEATERRALFQRMKEWAGKTKKVIVATAIPEAAKGYKVNPKAALTGFYYDNLNVIDNFPFEDFDEGKVDDLVGRIEARLLAKIQALEAMRKKSAPPKKV